jgi:hypothetical protein
MHYPLSHKQQGIELSTHYHWVIPLLVVESSWEIVVIIKVSKGCGQEIYFDANHGKSQSGKWIPLDKGSGLPHQCQ